MYWVNPQTLRITVGNKSLKLTPEEAVAQYSSNPFFWAEYNNLMNAPFGENGTTAEYRSAAFSDDTSNNSFEEIIDISLIRAKTESEIEKIMMELSLHESEDTMEQLRSCCKLQKYIAVHNEYDVIIMEQKLQHSDEYVAEMDLYNAVVLKSGVCSSNSIEMREILSRIGIKAECVGLTSGSNGTGAAHMAVLVELTGKYYYFDPTLERKIWQENASDPDNMVLCAAGLGEEEYCRFYTPQAIVPRDAHRNVSALPKNIATHRIPQPIVQSMVN